MMVLYRFPTIVFMRHILPKYFGYVYPWSWRREDSGCKWTLRGRHMESALIIENRASTSCVCFCP